jgi:hypothetical protein
MSAVLSETPLRPDTQRMLHLEGDHVVVTYGWFEANERQLRHLTEAALIAERATKARDDEVAALHERVAAQRAELEAVQSDARHWRDEAARLLREMNTPETTRFLAGALREAAHQRERWANDHDAHKGPEDWIWLVGHLAGKAVRNFLAASYAQDAAARFGEGASADIFKSEAEAFRTKGVHHIITAAAALANWHLHATGVDTRMQPGREFQADEEPETVRITVTAGPHP